jgi:hypothetical protein
MTTNQDANGNDPISAYKLDRTALSVASLDESDDQREYWHSKTPQERLEALEFLRIVHYGYDPTTARLQRLLTVAQLGED